MNEEKPQEEQFNARRNAQILQERHDSIKALIETHCKAHGKMREAHENWCFNNFHVLQVLLGDYKVAIYDACSSEDILPVQTPMDLLPELSELVESVLEGALMHAHYGEKE